MIDQLELYAFLRDAVATEDDLEWHIGLRAVVRGWTQRMVAAGASVESARAEIGETTSMLLTEARGDTLAPSTRVRDVYERIDDWVVETFDRLVQQSRRLRQHIRDG